MAALFFATTVSAQGLKGGWISCKYLYTNGTDNTVSYLLDVYHYNKKPTGGIIISFWDASNGKPVRNLSRVVLGPIDPITTSNKFSPCANTSSLNNNYLIRDDQIIYQVPPYSADNGMHGYLVTASFPVDYNDGLPILGIDTNIVNILGPSSTGILLTTYIPGNINGIDYYKNSNPDIDFVDTVSVCKGQYFSMRCTATDKDGDSLAYSFGNAIIAAQDTTSPPNIPVNYALSYKGAEPMGSGVTIDPVTGIIAGTVPYISGDYMISVYVQEWRKGVLINTTTKQSVIKVTNCPFQKPLLKPLYSSCRVNTFNFKNEPTCPAITKWLWDFGDTTAINDTSNSPTPTYTYPRSGTYQLKLTVANNYGYLDSITSIVKIFDSITLKINPDTAICATDTITLKPVSDAVNYVWRESGAGNTLSSYTIQSPKAYPSIVSTTYFIKGSLDNCYDSAKIIVHASPYPKARLGADTVICFGQKAMLNGTISGAFFIWNPASSLNNPNILQPIASPLKTTTYILTARDTFYCPKMVSDTEIVKVVPVFKVDAGPDVAVVVGQPYRLYAMAIDNTEIVNYAWQPSQYLNNNTVQNPYATIRTSGVDSVRFTVVATTVVGNCTATDDVVLKIYKIGPDIIVPTGFTPNGDGKNDVLKPILIGISRFDYFKIYNRFGQLLFTTSDAGKGWDGYINGEPQQAGTYVVMAHGIDYLGRDILKKETVILIR